VNSARRFNTPFAVAGPVRRARRSASCVPPPFFCPRSHPLSPFLLQACHCGPLGQGFLILLCGFGLGWRTAEVERAAWKRARRTLHELESAITAQLELTQLPIL